MLSVASVAIGAGKPKVAPKDTFSARIIAATGRYAGDQGGLTVYIVASQTIAATRQATLIFAGRRCSRGTHCLDLSGRTTGTLKPQRSIPDVGRSFAVSAAGTLKPLGHASVSGTTRGVGFVAKGHDQLSLSLKTSRGSVTLAGLSAPVSGSSSP